MIFYTDGSCSPNPGKGGWAYIAIDDDYEYHVNGYSEWTTNNIMELTAVLNLLKDFKKKDEFIIYSDSQYVIKTAKGEWKRKKNLELWQKYDKLSKGKKIKFIWVKGHSGNKFNEMVDILAKQAYNN